MQLVLASNSPRRRELLAQTGINFIAVPSLFDEGTRGLSACDTVLLFAREKAREVRSRYPDCPVLGADTVVCVGDRILGKPKDGAEAAGRTAYSRASVSSRTVPRTNFLPRPKSPFSPWAKSSS